MIPATLEVAVGALGTIGGVAAMPAPPPLGQILGWMQGSLPFMTLVLAGLVILGYDVLVKRREPEASFWFAITGVAASLFFTVLLFGKTSVGLLLYQGTLANDGYAGVWNVLFCATAFLVILISRDTVKTLSETGAEYYALLLFATSGMMMLAMSAELVTLFVALETMSIAVYILAGILIRDLKSQESAVKYFVIGGFSSALFIYGTALVYVTTGTTSLAALSTRITTILAEGACGPTAGLAPLFLLGVGLIFVGFAFKVAAVPFHMWAPDVYEGAPTPITAFMATGVKAAAFAAFLRVFATAFPSVGLSWALVTGGIAVFTMTLGNFAAIFQTNVKRMLAYSSIAHAGYLLLAITVVGAPGVFAAGNGNAQLGMSSIVFYLIAYTFMTIGAFAVVISFRVHGQEASKISDFRGIGWSHPGAGAALALFMVGLAGIPPTAGFAGKFFVFLGTVQAGFVGLAIAGVLNSLVSVYYYLGLVVTMYMEPASGPAGGSEVVHDTSMSMRIALVSTAAVTLLFGLFPGTIWSVLAHSLPIR